MVPVGQTYRPGGTFELRSLAIILILGVTAAVIGAALIWVWEISGIPSLVILTPLIQGLGCGLVLAFAIGRLHLRNNRLVAGVGFVCGLLSALLVHYGHYLRQVSTTAEAVRTMIVESKELAPDARQKALAQLDSDPASALDHALIQHTGHPGFVGSMILRNEQGVTVKHTTLTGPILWGLWGFESLMVASVAASLASARAAQTFCDECQAWCVEEPDALVIPSPAKERLLAAIQEDHVTQFLDLRTHPPEDDGSGWVGVTLNNCPGCDVAFASASLRVARGKNVKVIPLLANLRISPEMVDAIRGPLTVEDPELAQAADLPESTEPHVEEA